MHMIDIIDGGVNKKPRPGLANDGYELEETVNAARIKVSYLGCPHIAG